MFSCDYCEIFKKSFFYRTTPVTVSVAKQNKMATKRKPLQISFYGSRAIASVENCPPLTPKLILSQALTLTGGQFSSGAIVWLASPTLKLTLTWERGGNCPDTVLPSFTYTCVFISNQFMSIGWQIAEQLSGLNPLSLKQQ